MLGEILDSAGARVVHILNNAEVDMACVYLSTLVASDTEPV